MEREEEEMFQKNLDRFRGCAFFLPIFLALSWVGVVAGLSEAADKYPSRPVSLIVPYGPGGVSDIASKLVTEKMAAVLGQAFISQYKPGGGGSLGAAIAAKAKPDGYTVLVGGATPLILSPIVKKMDYKLDDFVQTGMLGGTPLWVAVKADAPWKTLKEFVEAAKKDPGKLNASSYGKLSTADFAIEMLNRQAGIKLNHIPYKSTPEALTAVLGGNADAAFVTGTGGLMEAGSVRVLAISGEKRLEGLPDIPTFRDFGYNIDFYFWYSLCVPKGTPQEVINVLANAHKKVFDVHGNEIKEGMRKIEVWAVYMGPKETTEQYKRDYDVLYKLADELGLVAK
jgi:tripartite-type tricarboxylate transporter receptor subunit TctC